MIDGWDGWASGIEGGGIYWLEFGRDCSSVGQCTATPGQRLYFLNLGILCLDGVEDNDHSSIWY